jgi:hypothetical protein
MKNTVLFSRMKRRQKNRETFLLKAVAKPGRAASAADRAWEKEIPVAISPLIAMVN